MARDEKTCAVNRVRYCAKCQKPVSGNHKFAWIPQRRTGYYRLEHRDCAKPDRYTAFNEENKP